MKLLGAILLVSIASVANALTKSDFPPHFLFGASTSAYQVEGAANEDGRKPSILDTFAHAGNGGLFKGDGDIASDQYHKYKDDVKLMAEMGLDAYRFSISWSRLIPDGRGPINPKGLEYYNKLINELTSQGIQAHVTLHHWDLPQTLEDEYGGWVSRRIIKDFTAYADVCFREFGDRVKHWTTVNEGNVESLEGYDLGFLAPQRCSPSSMSNCSKGNSSTEPYLVTHHMLLSHASAAKLYRTKYKAKQRGLIGFNILGFGLLPLTNTSEDIIATKRAQDFLIGWYMNPFIFGEYPDSMKNDVGSRLPYFTARESNLVKGSIDFLGFNFYYSLYVKNNPKSLQKENSYASDMAVEFKPYPGIGTPTDEIPVIPWVLPLSTSHPQMDLWLGNRKRIMVLNREDMISTADRNAWAEYFTKLGTKVVFSNGQLGMGTMKLGRLAKELAADVNVKRRAKGLLPRPVRAGIVGYPNVGKSSLINRLLKRRMCAAAPRPGVTRTLRWIRFGKDLELLDSPGILPMRISDQSAAIKLAICDDIGEKSYDVADVAAILVQMLTKLPAVGRDVLCKRYKFHVDSECGKIFVEKLALHLFNGDVHQAAYRVLSDFRKGRFGWTALERPPR